MPFNRHAAPQCCSAFLAVQSITQSHCHRTCSAIWESCQRECPSAGVTCERMCEWLCMRPRCLPRQSNPVTASGQNKTAFFPHNSATFRLSKSQKGGIPDKDKLSRAWELDGKNKPISFVKEICCTPGKLKAIGLNICTNYSGSKQKPKLIPKPI